VKQDGQADKIYYAHKDHLGSIVSMTDGTGTEVFKASYDAWGNRTVTDSTFAFHRGYTGHEHLPEFGLINMNGRMYDPLLGRFLSPDPFVQMPDYSQNFNRYSYCLNNPLIYTDPDGENPIIVAMIIGAALGMYSGGVIANDGQYNPIKWDYSSGKTWGYMLGGSVIGGASGAFGASIAANGGFMANTLGIMGGSFMNSVGMAAMTGVTPVSVSFGFGSYDFTNGKFRSIFDWKDLSTMEKIGYTLGAFSNLKDINDVINKTTAHLYTQTREIINGSGEEVFDIVSHSGIKSTDGDVFMSYGPASHAKLPGYVGFAVEPKLSTPYYPIPENLSLASGALTLNKHLFTGLRAISKISLYQGATSNCVNWASLGLLLNGIPNIGIHPFLLHGSMAIYNTGIYNVLSWQLTTRKNY
jgi:RHS repeat-associated protein